MFEQLDPQIKIVLFALMFAACLTIFLLGIVLVSIWLIERRKVRRMVRRLRAERKADEEAKAIFRRQKEREARRSMQDDAFSREMWEILSNEH